MFHYFQKLSADEDQQFNEFCHSQISNACLISGISDFGVGCEWDQFKAPQPIIEQPLFTLDYTTSATSMILCGDDFISQEIKFSDIELLQNEDFMSNIFYEYNDILPNEPSSPSHVMNSKSKSLSSDSLICLNENQIRPNSFYSTEMGSKREEYIKQPHTSDHTTETRMQKLSRYRDKKTKRNFCRQIKYACRKTLADGQPRVKGRFAKTDETDILRI